MGESATPGVMQIFLLPYPKACANQSTNFLEAGSPQEQSEGAMGRT